MSSSPADAEKDADNAEAEQVRLQDDLDDEQVNEEAVRPAPTSKERNDNDPFLVHWAPNDQNNPRNWSTAYKVWITAQLGLLAMAASLGSSITSPAQHAIAEYTGVGTEVSVLQISLYVLGFAFGPCLWAPMSELYGRKVSMLPAMFCLAIFSIGTAVSQNFASIAITRFFGGLFGSAPISNVGAALGDLYTPKHRGMAVTFYAVAVVGGPTIGPVIGAAITINPHLGWRWTAYILAIWVFAVAVLCFFTLPELYGPVLLKRKAAQLRKDTGDSRYWHPHENQKLDVKSVLTKHLGRPLRMLVTEPMVTCIALYASFVFGLLYCTLEVFPIVFQEIRGWSLLPASCTFLGLFVGILFAVMINLANQPRYMRIVDANGGRSVPEARLPPMVVGGVLFAIGLFVFGWTGGDIRVPWVVPVIFTAFIGAGFNIVFQQCINFLVDIYVVYAASALSANTFLRSLLAAAFPLVAKPMFHNLGIGPAMSILGAIATVAIAAPFIFMRYGLRLRKMSKFAPVDEN